MRRERGAWATRTAQARYANRRGGFLAGGSVIFVTIALLLSTPPNQLHHIVPRDEDH